MKSDITLDAGRCSVRDILAINPLPDKLDPFTAALVGGCDPVSAHQAVTLSGSGKSLVLQALEQLFLAREMREKTENARMAAAYTMLSAKERRELPVPQQKVRIFDGIPTALALLQQAQINDGEAIYISCTECGEFAKKAGNPYYALVFDMMKKSYDGIGSPYLHKTADKTYFVSSMRLCSNVGGTIEPMFRIFRQCDSDGTLSRGSLTMLGERKNEQADGAYKAPCWTPEQKRLMWQAADRLRDFDNRFREHDAAVADDGLSVEEREDRLLEERRRRALCVPEIIALGGEVKALLASYGTEVIDDCCSRADERAMGLAYLLYIANGETDDVLPEIVSAVRWWVKMSIDCAYALQLAINREVRSHRDLVRGNFKMQGIVRVQHEVDDARDEAFRAFEKQYEGTEKSLDEMHEIPIFQPLSLRTIRRLVQQRGYKSVKRGVYLVQSPATQHLEAA